MTGGDIVVDAGCLDALDELRSKRTVNTLIYRLDDSLRTVVCAFEGNLTHDELLAALPPAEPRSVVHHLSFALADGARHTAVLLILWFPPGVEPSAAAAHEAAHRALGDLLEGTAVHVVAADAEELAYDVLVERAR
jgi:cofilin